MSTPDAPKPALPPRPKASTSTPRQDTTPRTPPAPTPATPDPDPEPGDPTQGRKRVPAGVVAAILVAAVLIGMAALTGHLLPKDTGDAARRTAATASASQSTTTSTNKPEATPDPTDTTDKPATGDAVQIWDDTKSMTGSQLFRQNITKPLEDQVRQYGVTATASAPDADTVRIDLHTPDSLRGAGRIFHEKFDENPSFQRLADSIAPLCATPGPMRLNIRALTPDGTVVWQKTWTAKEA